MHFLASFLPFGSRFMVAWVFFAIISFVLLVVVNPIHIKLHEDDPYRIDLDDFFAYALGGVFVGFAYPVAVVLLLVVYLFSKVRRLVVGQMNTPGSINDAGWVRKLRQF